MAQINKPTDYFNTKLYTGNGSTNNITGVGFQPDWVWIKHRNNPTAYNHRVYDVVRGATKNLSPNGADAEITSSTELTSFDSDGFTLGSGSAANQNTINHVSWNWKAGGTASSNTDGTITSSVSASTTSGFSVVSYVGTGATATVGHGLGVAPKMLIVKNRDSAQNWTVFHQTVFDNNNSQVLVLNGTNAATTSANSFNSTAPTSSVFSIGGGTNTNGSGNDIIAYCFAEKKGFSKFGSYTGNGSADGTFVYTGFRVSWVMVKQTNTTGNWHIHNNKTIGYNPANYYHEANLTNAEATPERIDLLSNGFKQRSTGGSWNASGGSFIYMAFAEHPLVGTNNIPATAR